MQSDRTTALATAIVFATGTFWGLYWLPVRALEGLGLTGAWGTVAITGAAVTWLIPLAIARWRSIAQADPVALASIAIGGAAFTLYSVGFVYGRVAIIILLYFLTPVWSTLIGRYVLGWHTPRMRVLAIAVGMIGLVVMLGANGDVPVPRSTGEWMALLAGLLWSVATTGIRTRTEVGPFAAAFVFAVGATVAALVMAPFLEPLPQVAALDNLSTIVALAFAAGGIWWALSMSSLLWATARLEPARVGILLMAEVLVGSVSAALLAGERLHTLEIAGGLLVLLAGLLEVWPVRQSSATQTSRE